MQAALSPSGQYPTGTAKIILIATAISCAILELIDTTIVNVSLREISGNIGATTTEIAWVITAYSIANVTIIPLSGMLSNLLGRRIYFTASVAVFTFSSLMCGLSDSLWLLVFWRFVQGLGGGGLLSTAQSIIMDAFPPEKRMTGLVIYGMGVIIGPSFGPVLGGYISDHFSWNWIFFVNIPIGITAAFLSFRFVTNIAGASKPRIDWWGIGCLVIGIGSLQYVLEEGTTKDWFESGEISVFFALSLAGLIAFVIREFSIDYPAVNLRLYKSVNLAMGSLMNLLVGIIMTGTLFIFPLFVQASLGWTATQTGAFMIPGTLIVIVGMMVGKKLLEKGLNPKMLILAGLFMNCAYLTMLSFSSPDSSSSNFFWPFMIRGVGTIFMVMPILDLAVAGLTGKDLAQAIGLSNMFRQLGGAIGVALMNIYINHENAYVLNNMLGDINDYDPQVAERTAGLTQNFVSAGYSSDEAGRMAYEMVNNALTRQEMLISYNHGFLFVAGCLLLAVPVILLIRYHKKPAGALPVLGAH